MAGFVQGTGQSDSAFAGSPINSLLRFPNYILIMIIRLYRAVVSPWLPRVCRFEPTCSSYGLQAFRKYNFFKALGLTTWRILRCNPFCKGGSDPLP